MRKRRIKKAIKKVIELKAWATNDSDMCASLLITDLELRTALDCLYKDLRWIKYMCDYEAIPWPEKPRRMLRPKRYAAG